MFRLLAGEVPAAELTEVRRFASPWEAAASIRLRAGEPGVIAVYDRHGRIRAADAETARERAAAAWLADHLRGKDVLLLAGSNDEAADLARRVQARLIQAGHVSQRRIPGTGAAGRREPGPPRGPDPRPAQHRDRRRRAQAHQPRHPQDHRHPRRRRGGAAAATGRHLDRTVLGSPRLPRRQRRTRLRRQRARRPGPHRRHRPPPGHRHALPAIPVRRHEPRPRSQHRPRRHRKHRTARPAALPAGHPRGRAQERHGTRRRGTVGHRGHPAIPGMGQRNRAPAQPVDHRRPARHARRDRPAHHRPAHRDRSMRATSGNTPARPSTPRCAPPASPDTTSTPSSTQITAAPLDGARSIASVLHGRLQRLHLPDPGIPATWTQRTPASAPPAARELAGALDARTRELGHRHAARPAAVAHPPPRHHSPPARHRCSAQTTSGARWHRRRLPGSRRHHQPRTRPSHPNRTAATPNSSTMRQEAIRELEYRRRGRHVGRHGPRPARSPHRRRRTRPGHRAARRRRRATGSPPTPKPTPASKPPTPRSATTPAEAASASALAGELAARRQQLEAGNAKYEAWADRTRDREGQRQQGRRRTEPPRPHPAAASNSKPSPEATRNP